LRTRRHYPDHFVGSAVDRNRASNHPEISAKGPLPECVTDDDNIATFRAILNGCKGSAPHDELAEELEITGTDKRGLNLFGMINAGHVYAAELIGGDIPENVGLFPPDIEFCGRWLGVCEYDDAAGIGVRQRPKKHRANHGKNGCVRSDAERKGSDGGNRKSEVLPKYTNGVAQVVQDTFHWEVNSSALSLNESWGRMEESSEKPKIR
jgi:hypothetical protein